MNTAFRTPPFWLQWVVLCANVTADIGIFEQASPMIQELFKGSIGPVGAGGFVGLLSLFNMGGRFFWASTFDFIGRQPTYFIFFSLGSVLYYLLPKTGADHLNSVVLFVTISAVLLTMYGGASRRFPHTCAICSVLITSARFTADCLLRGPWPAFSALFS